MQLFDQFFDKRTLYVLLALLGVHGLAWAVQHHWLSVVPVVLAGLAAFGLTMKRLEWGIAFAFLEIFIGGHGHLFDLSSIGLPVSVRIAIFLGVMGAYTFITAKCFYLGTCSVPPVRWNARRDIPWDIFGLGILLGAIVGFLQNDLGNAFDDLNSYLPILYILPIISVGWDNEKKRLMLMTLAVSAVWIAASTVILLFGFTHLPGKFLAHLYTFVRDARLAEITILTAPSSIASLFPNGAWYFRVFEQSQIILFAFLFLLAGGLYYGGKTDKRLLAVMALVFAGIYASLSRSFAIGAVLGALVFFALLIGTRVPLRTIITQSVIIGCTKIAALIILWLAIVFPLPLRPDFTTSPFYKGDNTGARELAVSSRWNLLPPMMKEIWSSPIIGSGFGEEVTFVSDDPRVRAINGTGEWTTYRFEWGYQDLWLKMGILGLLGVLAIGVSFALATQSHLQKPSADKWIYVGLFSSTVFLMAVHAFTPYLNHPLGISLFLFPMIFFVWHNPQQYETFKISVPASLHSGSRSLGTGVVSRQSSVENG